VSGGGGAGVVVVVEGVVKTFDQGRIRALDGVSLQIAAGEFVALTGPSGTGKSTLLNLIGLLDRPDSGSIAVGGELLERIGDAARYRASTVGFVFQFHHLVPTLNALENVQLALVGRLPRREREDRARGLLAEVGLSERARSLPGTLSGGERQRVAIARALANHPRLLLADEPTGALDSATGSQVLELLGRLRDGYGTTVLMVTNDERAAGVADRRLALRDGVIRDEALRSASA
jgi:putative ABC transport system ATP-binding protein